MTNKYSKKSGARKMANGGEVSDWDIADNRAQPAAPKADPMDAAVADNAASKPAKTDSMDGFDAPSSGGNSEPDYSNEGRNGPRPASKPAPRAKPAQKHVATGSGASGFGSGLAAGVERGKQAAAAAPKSKGMFPNMFAADKATDKRIEATVSAAPKAAPEGEGLWSRLKQGIHDYATADQRPRQALVNGGLVGVGSQPIQNQAPASGDTRALGGGRNHYGKK